jgi:glutamate synthase (NADPH/NADH) small chain
VVEADLVIKALGFEPEGPARCFGTSRGWKSRAGARSAPSSGSGATNLPGVWAVGDIVRGASLVVWAIRDGREAADAILEQLGSDARIAAE